MYLKGNWKLFMGFLMGDSRPRKLRALTKPTVRLSGQGVAIFLGDLEARVMRAVWSMDEPATGRAVHDAVRKQHSVALLTVITVLNKLVGKKLLRRFKRQGLLHYEARLSEAEFRTAAAREVVEGILAFGPDAVTSSFVDVLAETDRDRLAELARLVRRKMREVDGD